MFAVAGSCGFSFRENLRLENECYVLITSSSKIYQMKLSWQVRGNARRTMVWLDGCHVLPLQRLVLLLETLPIRPGPSARSIDHVLGDHFIPMLCFGP